MLDPREKKPPAKNEIAAVEFRVTGFLLLQSFTYHRRTPGERRRYCLRCPIYSYVLRDTSSIDRFAEQRSPIWGTRGWGLERRTSQHGRSGHSGRVSMPIRCPAIAAELRMRWRPGRRLLRWGDPVIWRKRLLVGDLPVVFHLQNLTMITAVAKARNGAAWPDLFGQ